jgi:hypothetical protein
LVGLPSNPDLKAGLSFVLAVEPTLIGRSVSSEKNAPV